MKASHFRTPRTMEDCEFHSWGQAVFGQTNHTNKIGYVGALLVLILTGVICLLK